MTQVATIICILLHVFWTAGDNVKFNFPMAFSTTLLCWGLLEFKDAYQRSGQLDHMYDSIRWPLEYFVKCHTGNNELYVQVRECFGKECFEL